MANWLDKYEQGGMVLKQKTKDNYGKKPNANNSDVSLPPGFKGLAYNTKGRNYSPAWGGQFAMGGTLPGAVGFTYARTQNPAPSNGPYAKKTKASAQNGKEMKYYQEGLDFKPKSISQDGKKLKQLLTQPPKGDIESYYPELKRIKEAPKVAETKKEAEARAARERIERNATYVKPGPSEAQSRINRQQALELAKQEALQNSPLAQTLGSLTPSGYNPGAGAVGAETFVNMAPGISIIPSSVRLGQLYKGNDPYGFDQENIISFDNALASLGALGDVANVALPIKLGANTKGYSEISKSAGNTMGPFYGRDLKAFVRKKIGKQLNETLPTGTPASTRALASDATITEEGNRLLDRLASPEGRQRLKNQFKLADPELNDQQLEYLTATRINEINTAVKYNKARFYLDYGKGAQGTPTQNVPFTEYLPMQNAHFSEINLFPGIRNLDAPVDLFPLKAQQGPRPTNVSGRFNLAKDTVDDQLKAFANPDYRPGSIALGTGLELNKNVLAHEVMHAIQNKGVTPVDVDLLELLKPKNTADMLWRAGARIDPELKADLRYFTTSGGRNAKSEPLAFLEELRNRMLNKGIIKTDYEKITPRKLAKARLDAFRQGDRNFVEGTRLIKFIPPWKYGKLADIMNVAPATVPVVGAAALLGDEEQPPKQKEGGYIKKDDMGYWNPDNWGEPVEIGSNEITMEGVYEPLLGISDTGDVQMMYPGEDYTFDGESVTEIPMAQRGKKIKIPMSDFKKMGKSHQDSLNTYDYTQALWDAVRTQKSSELDKAILENKNLVRNTSNIKPTSYNNVNVGGKNYKIPNYKYPQMDPWETYDPVKGWWEKANDKLQDFNNYVGKTSVGKSFKDVDRKIEEGVKYIWNKFVDDDDENDVQNQEASSSLIKKQPIQSKATTITPPVVSKPKAKSTTKSTVTPKPDQFGLTKEDYITARKSKFVPTPGNKKGDGYYELKKDGNTYKVYTTSGGNSWVDVPQQKPKPKPVVKSEPVKEQPIKKQEQPKEEVKKQEPITPAKKIEEPIVEKIKEPVVEKKPIGEKKPYRVDYSGGSKYFYSSAEGDEFMRQLNRDFLADKIPNPGFVTGYYEHEKKKSGGKLKQIEKLDQSLNFTNYNKPTKGGWLNKYQ
jgi:hypothetical protein